MMSLENGCPSDIEKLLDRKMDVEDVKKCLDYKAN